MVLAVAIMLNPLGIDVIRAAFFASEALSRNIWGPIALTGMAIMALIVLLEWGIRKFIISRRARGTTSSS
jgi:Na+-transporting methylmalonyl-CoA/oxaloacetate decarboxylase beta subunit